ncbi:hypothetical protein UFOVP36_56 [uncultured Caudovirales phage]|uniref:Uncharacterized protein n=1 Tax=uncultured Caudovirales phage TaxID=2100421 RepID=A0A6J5KMS2_9CAUD|nr:hypothetical protein UFOVP36_56 [uncultured Caudovirales phage]
MNIIERIEARVTENKASVKTYKTADRAAATAAKLAKEFEEGHDSEISIRYSVIILPTTQRWTVIFKLTEWINRANQGTYLGHFSQQGFFTV